MIASALDARSEVINDVDRRGFLLGGASLAALLASCGGRPDQAPSTGAPPQGSGFPVTVAHKYGSTTIPTEPRRVVTVGLTDPDFVLALGVKPAAITNWYGDYPLGVWPWAQQALGDAIPGVMPRPEGDKINFELVASFQPDLIIGMYTGMTEDEYERASRLAPTVAQSAEHQDYLMPWQFTMRTVGQAVGRSAQAEDVIAGVGSRFAAARREHPEFAGATLIVAERFETGTTYIRTAKEPQNALFRDLGFVQPAPITELLTDEDGYSGNISDERMELLDVIFGSPLSLPYALDRIVPMLAAALDGDPATKPIS